jgi:glucose/arabinose dehydrogenase
MPWFRSVSVLALSLLTAGVAIAQPAAPVITEPNRDSAVVSAYDVHMETGPFSDPSGFAHRCSDWQILRRDDRVIVWRADCAAGPLRLHTHLGDGVFVGPLAGQGNLNTASEYILRVRHRSASSNPATEYSPWTERTFITEIPSAFESLRFTDVQAIPTPTWNAAGQPLSLPASGANPHVLILEAYVHEHVRCVPAVTFSSSGGAPVVTANTPPSPDHADASVCITAGSNPLVVPASEIRFRDDDCKDRTIALPALNLAAGQNVKFWVTSAGSTFVRLPADMDPTFSTLARTASVPFEFRQDGFILDRFATGFQLPVSIAFHPNPGPAPTDPLFYVAELYGTIKVVTRGRSVGTYASSLLDFVPSGQFPGSGEMGIASIIVEPSTGDLLVSSLYPLGGNIGNLHPRITRLRSTDGGRTSSSRSILWQRDDTDMAAAHQIAALNIAPDGKLLVNIGDGFYVPGARDLNWLAGKILRMNMDGSAPTDNPFFNPTWTFRRNYVWALGYRNPWGGAIRAADGQLYVVENGPAVDRLSRATRGTDFAWAGADADMYIGALHTWTPATAPVCITFIQPQTFGGSAFPPDRQDRAFVTLSGSTFEPGIAGKKIVEFGFGSNGAVNLGPRTLLEYTGAGQSTVAALAAGPDGLYFSDLYPDTPGGNPTATGASVWRVRWTGVRPCVGGCAADFNADGSLTPTDLFAFITAYFAGNPTADFDGSGVRGPEDLFTFFAAFFAGCP